MGIIIILGGAGFCPSTVLPSLPSIFWWFINCRHCHMSGLTSNTESWPFWCQMNFAQQTCCWPNSHLVKITTAIWGIRILLSGFSTKINPFKIGCFSLLQIWDETTTTTTTIKNNQKQKQKQKTMQNLRGSIPTTRVACDIFVQSHPRRVVAHHLSKWFQPIWKILVKLDHFPK